MSVIQLSLLPGLGRETVYLPILPVLLRTALAPQAECPTFFVQINVVLQGARAQRNNGTIIDGKGAILRCGGAHIRGGRAHFGGAGFISKVHGG
jgi:hypothetical protein